ncbi:MAG: hypothetical protein NVSMB17_13520 [Candidatus Dormibacteria bacterium]
MVGLVSVPVATPVRAATPASGTIASGQQVTWQFSDTGDTFDLTVKLPAPAATFYAPNATYGTTHAAVLSVAIHYQIPAGDTALNLSATDPSGKAVGSSTFSTATSGSDDEALFIDNPIEGKYTISVGNLNPINGPPEPAVAVAILRTTDMTATPRPSAPPPAAPTYGNYPLPLDLMPVKPYETTVLGGRAFGEPSIGVNPKTDAVLYQAGLYTLRAKFDNGNPARVSWKDVSPVIGDSATLDAIGYVDRAAGRTFVDQLTLACSLSEYSDNDGDSWTPSTKPCQTPPAVDHQTIGSGRFRAPLPDPGIAYPDAVYYCSQNIAQAECATSLDGGNTYGQANVIFTSSECFGLHGHIKAAPDGTLYVPNKACGAPECQIVTSTAGPDCHRAVSVSEDNGLTWTVRTAPESHAPYIAGGDPSVAIGSKGTVYMGYDERGGRPRVAISRDKGLTWTYRDVAGPYLIRSTQLAVMVAGDDDRASMAFLGSPYLGQDQDAAWAGTYHMYIATTYDGGGTWTTVDATPDKPIQRGCIEFGGSCPRGAGHNQRNLLDFNDATLDREGRLLVAYTDGCNAACAADPKHVSGSEPGGIKLPSVIRQQCGRSLYAAFDAQQAAICPVAANTAANDRVAPAVVNPAPAVLPNTSRPADRTVLWLSLAGVACAAAAYGLGRRFSGTRR